MSFIINSLLTLVFVAVLVLPVTVNHFVIMNGNGGGLVAGARQVSEKDINIIPNLKDFNGHVNFSPSEIENGVYYDTLEMRVFQRQKASYRGLYTIYNLSDNRTFEFSIATSGVAEMQQNDPSFESVRIIEYLDDYQDEITEDLNKGDTLIKVKDISNYRVAQKIMIGAELTKIVAMSESSIVVTPLLFDHLRGELVYPESIYLRAGQLISPVTDTVVLQPGEKLMIDAIVEGTSDLRVSDEMIQLPININVDEIL